MAAAEALESFPARQTTGFSKTRTAPYLTQGHGQERRPSHRSGRNGEEPCRLDEIDTGGGAGAQRDPVAADRARRAPTRTSRPNRTNGRARRTKKYFDTNILEIRKATCTYD